MLKWPKIVKKLLKNVQNDPKTAGNGSVMFRKIVQLRPVKSTPKIRGVKIGMEIFSL